MNPPARLIHPPESSAGNTGPDEALLVESARRGDLKAFSALVEACQERAVRAAYSWVGNYEDARDLAQEAFVKAYENLARFKGESRFYTWFYRILSNGCTDHLRKKKVRRAISFWSADESHEDAEEKIPDASHNAKEELLNRELGEEIYRAMEGLPARQKSVFMLRYLDGMSLEEIASSLRLSTGAVKAHLWQAARKMKDFLNVYLEPEDKIR